MSQANVEVIRRGYEHFRASGEMDEEITADNFVWDMSKFRGWPEQQRYEGVEGAITITRSPGWIDSFTVVRISGATEEPLRWVILGAPASPSPGARP
jgi:hypothetical protein